MEYTEWVSHLESISKSYSYHIFNRFATVHLVRLAHASHFVPPFPLSVTRSNLKLSLRHRVHWVQALSCLARASALNCIVCLLSDITLIIWVVYLPANDNYSQLHISSTHSRSRSRYLIVLLICCQAHLTYLVCALATLTCSLSLHLSSSLTYSLALSVLLIYSRFRAERKARQAVWLWTPLPSVVIVVVVVFFVFLCVSNLRRNVNRLFPISQQEHANCRLCFINAAISRGI